MELLLGTANLHKARELSAMIGDLPLRLRTLRDLEGPPEVDEDGDTLEANASKKALSYAAFSGLWTLADDTGLEVDALDGAPGVKSARFAGAAVDFASNNRKLLEALEPVPPEERGATFRCVLALASPNGELTLEKGAIRGHITDAGRGASGFGYDPVFFVPACGKTMAEMTFEEKAASSHRAAAMEWMRPHLERLSRSESAKSCPRCGLALAEWHCRMLCPGCGYQEDCSDVALP